MLTSTVHATEAGRGKGSGGGGRQRDLASHSSKPVGSGRTQKSTKRRRLAPLAATFCLRAGDAAGREKKKGKRCNKKQEGVQETGRWAQGKGLKGLRSSKKRAERGRENKNERIQMTIHAERDGNEECCSSSKRSVTEYAHKNEAAGRKSWSHRRSEEKGKRDPDHQGKEEEEEWRRIQIIKEKHAE